MRRFFTPRIPRDFEPREVLGSSSMPYPIFDRSRLQLKPLSERVNDMTLADVLPLDAPMPTFDDPQLPTDRRPDRARAAGSSARSFS